MVCFNILSAASILKAMVFLWNDSIRTIAEGSNVKQVQCFSYPLWEISYGLIEVFKTESVNPATFVV